MLTLCWPPIHLSLLPKIHHLLSVLFFFASVKVLRFFCIDYHFSLLATPIASSSALSSYLNIDSRLTKFKYIHITKIVQRLSRAIFILFFFYHGRYNSWSKTCLHLSTGQYLEDLFSGHNEIMALLFFSNNIGNAFPKISQCMKMTTRNSFSNEKMNHHYQAKISNQFLKTVIKYI